MNATNLIDHSDVKNFLLENFPKPTVNRKEILPAISTEGNKNPSLTGNAFEIFLRILSLKTKADFENEFESEKKTALWNINRTYKLKSEPIIFKDHLRICLNKDDYESKASIIKKLLNKNSISFEDVSKKFKYSIIGYINDDSYFKIFEKTNLIVGSFSTKNFYSLMLKDNDPYTIIINKDTLVDFIDSTLKKFETEVLSFIQKKELNKDFVELILEFTQISCHPFFFKEIHPSKGFHFEESYIDYIFNLFNCVYQRKDIHGKSPIHHPTLKCSSILATPDFLIGNKILEIKTSKDFFSTEDYLQGLAYLLLTHDSQNKKRWGAIKEAEIFYPVFDMSVTIKMKEDDDRIKPALKFLKDFSTDEPKEKLRKLKEAVKRKK